MPQVTPAAKAAALAEVEVWKDCAELLYKYQVSSFGRIRNTATGYIRKQSVDSDGYMRFSIRIDRKMVCKIVHKLVSKLFLEENGFTVVNHKDGDRKNNRADNLEYVSVRENTTHGKNAKRKYTGASFCKRTGRWRAQLKLRGKTKYIGEYGTEEEASNAYHNFIKVNGLENRYARKQ